MVHHETLLVKPYLYTFKELLFLFPATHDAPVLMPSFHVMEFSSDSGKI